LKVTFGRLFLARQGGSSNKDALKNLTEGIYKQCEMDGPESPKLCSSYFYLGEYYKKENMVDQARAVYKKICEIWVKFILNEDFEDVQGYGNYQMNLPDVIYMEGEQHLRNMLLFFEMQFGVQDTVTAEAQYAYGLVAYKISAQTGNGLGALEAL
jgi:tetratricopeptide (TPR) repeat protein